MSKEAISPKVPELSPGQIFFVRRAEYNMTEVWQIQGRKCVIVTELTGDVTQAHTDYKELQEE